MASTIKVDNVQNQPGTNIINKCSVTTTIGAGAGETVAVCAATVTLGRCGGTVALASGATQTGFGRTGTVDWDTTPKTGTVTAATGKGYFVDTTSGGITVNLPAGVAGSIVSMADYAATWQTNNVTVTPNGSEKIGSVNASVTLSTEGQSVTFVYVDSTQGWINTMDSTSNVRGNAFIIAAGGNQSPTCGLVCGDYKTHIFTGPGTFCVTAAGDPAGSTTVDYLVVAGGGGGGSGRAGGGGAGGFRLSNSVGGIPAPTMSPLANPVGLTASVSAFPIQVGAGGPTACYGAPPSIGVNGNPSIFSTITSTAGGGGGQDGNTGADGGSGGGGGESSVSSHIGAGNTPATPISQGFPGGASDHSPPTGGPHPVSPAPYAGGGGGGAAQQGQRGAPGGPGGAGSFVADGTIGPTAPSYGTPGPTPNTRYFAGGGGGIGCTTGSPGGSVPGGVGGGGTAPAPGSAGCAGTINTGGGGSAFGNVSGPGLSGAGGSGIVIIRYKFQ